MKRIILLVSTMAWGLEMYAQPIISNAGNLPPVGYSDSIGMVISTSVLPGNGGANVTWDLSSLVPNQVGTIKIVAPSSTPYASNFSVADYANQISPFTGSPMFEYWKITASKIEVLGSGITTGGGKTYFANPKTVLPFPFVYGQSYIDTFEASGSGINTLTITYDGYGTLKTPYATYNNVVRSKRDFGGSDYFYEWYTTTPYLFPVANYDNNTMKFSFVGKFLNTGIVDHPAQNNKPEVYPNPASDYIMVNATDAGNWETWVLTDISGRVLTSGRFVNGQEQISCKQFDKGTYIIRFQKADGSAVNHKILVQ